MKAPPTWNLAVLVGSHFLWHILAAWFLGVWPSEIFYGLFYTLPTGNHSNHSIKIRCWCYGIGETFPNLLAMVARVTCSHWMASATGTNSFTPQLFFVPAASCRDWRDYLLHLNLNTSTQPHGRSVNQNKIDIFFVERHGQKQSKHIFRVSGKHLNKPHVGVGIFMVKNHWRPKVYFQIQLENPPSHEPREKKLATFGLLVFLGNPNIGLCNMIMLPISKGATKKTRNSQKKTDVLLTWKTGPKNP